MTGRAHSHTHELAEYIAAIGAQPDEPSAVNAAVAQAMAALAASIGAAVIDGAVSAYTGPPGLAQPTGLAEIPSTTTFLPIEGSDPFAAAVTSPEGSPPIFMIVARPGNAFSAEEKILLFGMARALGLALSGLRRLATGHTMMAVHDRETDDRLRLLNALGTRQRLLETVLSVQRSIATRQPLQEILDAVTRGTASLLHRATVALMVAEHGSDQLTCASLSGRPEGCDDPLILAAAAEAMQSNRIVARPAEPRDGEPHDVIAAPVIVRGVVTASLAADAAAGCGHVIERRELLAAFAQQVGLALTEAKISETIRDAHHDAITGLANRALFLEHLHGAMTTANMRLTDVTILLVDIHRFKAVNDSLGHKAGDAVLSAVAERVRSCLRAGDLIARVGGDEFGVLLDGAGTQAGTRVAKAIIDAIRAPLRISGRSIYLNACVGVASCRTSSAASGDLFNSADLAMNRAISAGAGRIEVYEPHMHAEILERINLLDDLQVAMARTQLRLQYQPLVDLATGSPVGVEALARWHHPLRGEVPPLTFIPLAEETGLILDLGWWILREGCRQVAEWRALVPDMRLNINVSARQAMDPGFVDSVSTALAEAGLPGSMLTLELTESILMKDPERALVQLKQLKSLGVRLSIDDFGTGYSSLSYLRQFPVDQLKIDRAFITDAATSGEQLAVTRTVMDLGRTLQLETVAEGIEDDQQLDVLRAIGCDLGQGFLLARPMEPDAVREYFARLIARR